MTSKQQASRHPRNPSSAASQPAIQSLIFSNVYFDGSQEKLLHGLRRNYKGVDNVVPLYLRNNNGNSMRAVRIDVNLGDLVKQFVDEGKIRIGDKEYAFQSSSRSVVISNVAPRGTDAQLLQDLGHNYIGVERISRFYGLNGRSVDHIRIDFKSEASPMKLLQDKYIIIDGKRCPVRAYWSFISVPNENQNEEEHASEQSQTSMINESQKSVARESQKFVTRHPQTYLTEQRVKELFREQQMQLEAMINEFENKWTARLSSAKTASTNPNADQLLPIIKDLSTVCQQFNQQNSQIQRQIGSAIHQVQTVQMKLNNKEDEQDWPQLPIQNGH